MENLSRIAQAYLSLQIGQISLGPLATAIVILAIAAALVSATRLWHIGQREEIQKRLGTFARQQGGATGIRPPWYHRLGSLLAAKQLIGLAEQEKLLADLAAAGIRGRGRLPAFIAVKLGSAIACVVLTWLLLDLRHFLVGAPLLRVAALAAAFIFGWRYLPDAVLSRLAARRRYRLETGVPDALDLLVICAEAGLSLDQAIEEVGRELAPSNREIAEEFAITSDEMRVLPDRGQALENLAARCGLPTLRSLVATLVQSIRFGTPLADSLRVIASEMRAERLAKFEERAARLPVLLTIPLMGFILPSLMMVLFTPLVLRIFDFLSQVTVRAIL